MLDLLLINKGGTQEWQGALPPAPADDGQAEVPEAPGFARAVADGAEARQRLLKCGPPAGAVAEGRRGRPESMQGVAFLAFVADFPQDNAGAGTGLDRLWGITQGQSGQPQAVQGSAFASPIPKCAVDRERLL